jgi:hypothetical protein
MLAHIARGADGLAIGFYDAAFALMTGNCSYRHHYAAIVVPFSADCW